MVREGRAKLQFFWLVFLAKGISMWSVLWIIVEMGFDGIQDKVNSVGGRLRVEGKYETDRLGYNWWRGQMVDQSNIDKAELFVWTAGI